ncbi:aminotransferase class-V [Cordyceps fumosorosea ARSEF 2679]|uniref:Aminotransferase class-V n=1 Tax=Cordyceps fumosorosea (strain ARSEF 2679) TaxID=1081104 RepID=A0A167TIA3_CORFA|nr:aminotransferase class-V [Cordyceps fumosorosea ARSEF 2679]OAA60626.1 aminotransferase class-V [Cordyceps fumosorosea ARSEF 2679]
MQSKESCTDQSPRAKEFLDRYPEYASTTLLDDLRATEYSFLDENNHIYLDYTGAGLAAHSQHEAHRQRLRHGAFGNPHSVNPTSQATTDLVEETRSRILRYFSASADEYTVIFTPNATGAARLVGESYPWRRGARLVLTADNHNSLNGLREFARRGNSRTVYVPVDGDELRTWEADVVAALEGSRCSPADWLAAKGFAGGARGRRRGLFAYPAQSNFTGVRHPLSWVGLAQDRGYDVLLDAAAYLPTATLDLSSSSGGPRPDFVTVSWYKVFGAPTGVGCLVARREALARLRRPWFAGGTVRAATTGSGRRAWHVPEDGAAAFEDGTVDFLSIPDVAVGLDWVARVGGPDVVATRVRCLTGWLLDELRALRHGDGGGGMVVVYGPVGVWGRGGTVCFNVLDRDGVVFDERLVAAESSAAGISLRTGCFCNPGAGAAALGITPAVLDRVGRARAESNGDLEGALDGLGLTIGAIRVSLGIASVLADVEALVAFVEATYRDRVATTKNLPPRGKC